MGTRADFYVGRGKQAEWIGSITWDGYPGGISPEVFAVTTERDYRAAVAEFFSERDDVTHPSEPWPWPWENSATTDYAYAFDAGTVYASSFGHAWFEVKPDADCYGEPEEDGDQTVVFPDMTDRKGDWNHIMSRSGLIVVQPVRSTDPE